MAFEELVKDLARYVVQRANDKEIGKDPNFQTLKEFILAGDSTVKRDERGFREVEDPPIKKKRKEPEEVIDAEFVDL